MPNARNLFVMTPDFPPATGGIQTMLHEIVRRGSRDSAVITADQPGAADFDRQQPFQVLRLKFTSDRIITRTLELVQAGLPWARSGKYAAIHCGHVSFAGAAYQLRMFSRLPYWVYSYGMELLPLRHGGGKAHVYKFFLRQADRHITISRYTRQLLIDCGVDARKIDIVPLGVDTARLRPNLDTGEIRQRLGLPAGRMLLTVARLMERKGHAYVLQALALLRDQMPDLHYLIVGDGPQRNGLHRLISELGLQDRARLLGRVAEEDLPLLYNCCDVFVMPAAEIPEKEEVEGFGLVFLEAMACGKPVIGGNSGGIPDAIPPQAGLIVPPKDANLLAAAIAELLSDPAHLQTMGVAGLQWTRDVMTWDRTLERILQGKV